MSKRLYQLACHASKRPDKYCRLKTPHILSHASCSETIRPRKFVHFCTRLHHSLHATLRLGQVVLDRYSLGII